MSCYLLAQIRITDGAVYDEYLARVDAVVSRYGGEYLAVDDAAVVLEGEWGPGRFVLIRFASEAALREWYLSDDYQGIVGYRLAAAECRALALREGPVL